MSFNAIACLDFWEEVLYREVIAEHPHWPLLRIHRPPLFGSLAPGRGLCACAGAHEPLTVFGELHRRYERLLELSPPPRCRGTTAAAQSAHLRMTKFEEVRTSGTRSLRMGVPVGRHLGCDSPAVISGGSRADLGRISGGSRRTSAYRMSDSGAAII